MPDIHCGMHNKLSKTMGVTIEVYGRNNYFTVPYTKNRATFISLDKQFIPMFFDPLPQAEEGNMQFEGKYHSFSATELSFCVSVPSCDFLCVLYGGGVMFPSVRTFQLH